MGCGVTLDHRCGYSTCDFPPRRHRREPDHHSAVTIDHGVKANERVPLYWITDVAARTNLTIVRLSKYCRPWRLRRAHRSVFPRAQRRVQRRHERASAGNEA